MRDISRSRGPSAVTSRTRPADSTPWRRRASVRWSGLATSGRSVVTSRLYQGWHVTGSPRHVPFPTEADADSIFFMFIMGRAYALRSRCAPIGKPPLLPDDSDGKIAWLDQHRAAMAKSEPAAQAPPLSSRTLKASSGTVFSSLSIVSKPR